MSRFPYKKEKTQSAFDKIVNLYSKIPETEGCMESLDTCKAFCCFQQNPQLLYCEFLRTLDFVLKNWDEEEFLDLFEKSLKNYLSKEIIKGCVFWDKETRLCKIHKYRPLSCYLYGITPEEEFESKLKRLREKYKDEIVKFRDQCDLIKTKDGSQITVEDTDRWWNRLVKIERSIGIDKDLINDDPGGTYRTYHDHLLIFYLSDYLLENLSQVRQFGEPIEKQRVIETVLKLIGENL